MRFRICLGFLFLIVTIGCGSSESQVEPAPREAPTESAGAAPDAPAPPEETEPGDEADAAAKTTRPKDETPTVAVKPKPSPSAKADKPVARAPKKDRAAAPAGPHPGLKDPSKANQEAPEDFRVRFETTKGDFVVEIKRQWAPKGADRFFNLVKIGYFEDVAFFRVIDGFIVQFGLSGDPEINRAWEKADIQDDPVTQSNQRGTITFATGGPNTRTTQLFINFGDNRRLDPMGFTPLGKVVEGMQVVDSLYSAYGEGAPYGPGPNQQLIGRQGNAYLRASFPNLDYIKRARIVK